MSWRRDAVNPIGLQEGNISPYFSEKYPRALADFVKPARRNCMCTGNFRKTAEAEENQRMTEFQHKECLLLNSLATFDVHRYGSFPLEMNSFHPSNTRIMAWIRVYHQNLNSQNWCLGNGKDWAKYHLRVNYPFKRLNSAIHVKDFSNIMKHTKKRTAGWWMQSPFLFHCTTNAGLCP